MLDLITFFNSADTIATTVRIVTILFSIIIAYYSYKIGQKVGYTKLWNEISIGFLIIMFGRIILLGADLRIANEFLYFGLFVISIGSLIIILGFKKLYKILKDLKL